MEIGPQMFAPTSAKRTLLKYLYPFHMAVIEVQTHTTMLCCSNNVPFKVTV